MSHPKGPGAEKEHIRRVFSVDDDPAEVEHDIRYLEGLHDGIKYTLQGKTKQINPSNNDMSNSVADIISTHSTPLQPKLSHSKSRIINNAAVTTGSTSNTSPLNGNPGKPSLDTRKSAPRLAIVISPDSGLGFELNSRNNSSAASNGNINSNEHINTYSNGNTNTITNANSTNDIKSRNKANNIGQEFLLHDPPNNDLLIEELSPNLENNDRSSTTSSLESYTLRERQDAINETHPFGIRIWKPALYKKHRSVQKAANEDIHETTLKTISWAVHLTNLLWTLTFGLFLFILFSIASISVVLLGLFTNSSREYGKVFFNLALYLLWPFGKLVYLNQDEHYLQEDKNEGISVQQFYKWVNQYSNRLFFHQSQAIEPHVSLNGSDNPSYGSIQHYMTLQRYDQEQQQQSTPRTFTPPIDTSEQHEDSNMNTQRRYFGRGEWSLGRILFYMFFHLILEPIVLLLSLLTWLAVFTIPVSNILWNLMYHCRRHPLALGFKNIKNSTNEERNPIMKNKKNDTRNVLLCTFRCAGWHYYKFTVDGTNVIVVNLISLVFFTIFDFYVIKSSWNVTTWFTNESSIFILCLASIVPLAFYIGQAVASISAQTSMGVGAVINAFFSTIVEVFLYCVALNQKKGQLVEGSMIGSVLGAVLLLPGLSMCGGALNRKTQRYNPASAGVSSALLIFSMIVMFVPTVLYELYGNYTVVCADKPEPEYLSISTLTHVLTSSQCYFHRPPLTHNKMYTHIIQPMSITCALVLFLAYAIGLWFTLRTHAKMIWQLPISDQQKEMLAHSEQNSSMADHDQFSGADIEEENCNGHDAPNWSRSKSTGILLVATLLYAIIAEILVACVDSVLEDFPGLDPKFLGLTIFALVPNTTEFLNAISFAIHGNVALSMEIGSAYALQVCLLQIPALVLYSIYYTWKLDPSTINIKEQMFPLVFPRWDLIGTVASIFMFTYLYAEGKSNYFKGSMLILMYFIVIMGFYFQGVVIDWA